MADFVDLDTIQAAVAAIQDGTAMVALTQCDRTLRIKTRKQLRWLVGRLNDVLCTNWVQFEDDIATAAADPTRPPILTIENDNQLLTKAQQNDRNIYS